MKTKIWTVRLCVRYGFAMLLSLFFHQFIQAQEPTETGPPLDDFTERSVISERQPLHYAPVRESDLLYERRIWRVVDVREKMNLPFVYPDAPLFEILKEGVLTGKLTAYSTEDDHFSRALTDAEMNNIMYSQDTLLVYDFTTDQEVTQTVQSEINWEDVKRFRIQEAWFFDARTSSMQVRILGIAPLKEEYTSEGDFKFERPLFWIHFPSARPYLAQHKAFSTGNNLAANVSWEDLFEMRYFASYIVRDNNVYGRKLEEYLAGTDLLFESDRIKNDLLNYDLDLWQH